MFHFRTAMRPEGWSDDVRMRVADGLINAIETAVSPAGGDDYHAVTVPGMPDLHSHPFQRLLAGRVETIFGPGERRCTAARCR
jgi:formimidoylglutamate deiminase